MTQLAEPLWHCQFEDPDPLLQYARDWIQKYIFYGIELPSCGCAEALAGLCTRHSSNYHQWHTWWHLDALEIAKGLEGHINKVEKASTRLVHLEEKLIVIKKELQKSMTRK